MGPEDQSNAETTIFSRGLGVVVGMWTTPTLWKGLAEPFRSSCGVSKPFAVGQTCKPLCRGSNGALFGTRLTSSVNEAGCTGPYHVTVLCVKLL